MKLATDIYFAQMRSLIDLYSNARDSLPQNQKFTFSLLCGAVNADNSLTPKHSGWIKCTRGKRKNELLVLGWNVPLYLFICTRGNSRTPLTTGSNCRVRATDQADVFDISVRDQDCCQAFTCVSRSENVSLSRNLFMADKHTDPHFIHGHNI